jgi:hypothetical protein
MVQAGVKERIAQNRQSAKSRFGLDRLGQVAN